MISRSFAKSHVAVALAALLACALFAAAPAAAPQAHAATDAAPVWTYVGKKISLSDPANLKWWNGDDATTVYRENSLTMDMMHCLGNGELNYMFTENAAWSQPPQTIPIGQEDAVEITGTLSISKIQYSETYLAYTYGGEADAPVAGLDLHFDLGYFDPDDEREAKHEMGKKDALYGQTVFPRLMSLGSMHLEGAHTQDSLGHSVLLRTWEEAEIDFAVKGNLAAEATDWEYAERIARGDYTIGNAVLEAKAYVLTLTLEDKGAGYRTEYYYEFAPGRETVPYVAADDGGEVPANTDNSTAVMAVSLVLFIVCCVVAFGISQKVSKGKRKKAAAAAAEVEVAEDGEVTAPEAAAETEPAAAEADEPRASE